MAESYALEEATLRHRRTEEEAEITSTYFKDEASALIQCFNKLCLLTFRDVQYRPYRPRRRRSIILPRIFVGLILLVVVTLLYLVSQLTSRNYA
jgi:hypothetical protein